MAPGVSSGFGYMKVMLNSQLASLVYTNLCAVERVDKQAKHLYFLG